MASHARRKTSGTWCQRDRTPVASIRSRWRDRNTERHLMGCSLRDADGSAVQSFQIFAPLSRRTTKPWPS